MHSCKKLLIIFIILHFRIVLEHWTLNGIRIVLHVKDVG